MIRIRSKYSSLISIFNLKKWIVSFNQRRLIVLSAFSLQILIVAASAISLLQPLPPKVTLAALAGKPDLCQISSIAPLTYLWWRGVPTGTIVQVEKKNKIPPEPTCPNLSPLPEEGTSPLRLVNQTASPVYLNVISHPIDSTNLLLAELLALILSLTGATIFLYAKDRGMANKAYALFYCTSLIFNLFNLYGLHYLWSDLLLYALILAGVGASVTFVWVFPGNLARYMGSLHLSPYLPVVSGLALALLSLPIFAWNSAPAQLRLGLLIVVSTYSLVCVALAVVVMCKEMLNFNSGQWRIAWFLLVGLGSLLLPLLISLGEGAFTGGSFTFWGIIPRLVGIPILLLTVTCSYVIIRYEQLGLVTPLSRQFMRVVGWLLLSLVFILPGVLLLRYVAGFSSPQREGPEYLYIGLLILSLWLFPLTWRKLQSLGDQVFYGDFYHYNYSLSQLSVALTTLQGLDQICNFVLPYLAALVNANEVALLVKPNVWELKELPPTSARLSNLPLSWKVYTHHLQSSELAVKKLMDGANLVVQQFNQPPSYQPVSLDGLLYVALYDGQQLNGFLCLSSKLNGEPYSPHDKTFLETVAAELSVILVNNRYLEQARVTAQELAAFNQRVVTAQEEERRRLALELHDAVLQEAMLLVRQLADAADMTDVAVAMPLAREIVSSLRRTCLELRPPLLDELGLREALQWLARQVEQTSQLEVKVTYKTPRLKRPSDEVEIAFYRVAQEALSNAVKHSGANRVSIRVHYYPDGKISLLVCDNGRGFKREPGRKQFKPGSLGLVGMRERMTAIGGRVQLHTNLGYGVSVRAVYTQPLIEATPTTLD